MPRGKPIDRTGQVFGRLTVVSDTGKRTKPDRNGNTQKIWLCRCECGGEKEATPGNLLNGGTKSCGCLLKETFRENGKKRRVDYVGRKYGRLTVLESAGKGKHNEQLLSVACDCGKRKTVRAASLVSGSTKSCGCLWEDTVKGVAKKGKDIAGQRFGRLVAVSDTGERTPRSEKTGKGGNSAIWLCKCDCGKEKRVSQNYLQTGDTKSCGCLGRGNSRRPLPSPKEEPKPPGKLAGFIDRWKASVLSFSYGGKRK